MKLSCGSRAFSKYTGVWLQAEFCVAARVLPPQWLRCAAVAQPNPARNAFVLLLACPSARRLNHDFIDDAQTIIIHIENSSFDELEPEI